MKISILLPTNRTGGLDIVCSSLEKQTFKDFELIVSDCLYKYRKDIVAEKAKQFSFPIIHVEPFSNLFPLGAFCHTANTAIAYSSGDIALMITDYTWLPPDCLQIHHDFHTKTENTMLMCPHQYTDLPPLNKNHKAYSKTELIEYFNDLNYGVCNDVMWSIFEKDFDVDASNLPVDAIMGWADLKMNAKESEHNYGLYNSFCMYFNAKNESMPMKQLLDTNGWDEQMDGTHVYQDTEIALRLEYEKLNFSMNPNNIAYIVNPRHIFPLPAWLRDIETNKDIFFANQAKQFPRPNKWSIREKRNKILDR